MLLTPEDRPLALFGPAASGAVAQLLDLRAIRVETATVARSFEHRVLRIVGGAELEADAVVTLPKLEGQPLEGVPQDRSGFVATDDLGWVFGLTDVYAAGDLTQSLIKQAGLAAQQADAVASAIAADVGAAVRPATFKPVLRGLLLTGLSLRFLRAERGGRPSLADTQPLWWPPSKVVGRYLTPFLAHQLGPAGDVERPPPAEGTPVEVALDAREHAVWSPV